MDNIWNGWVEWLKGFGAQAGQQAADTGAQIGGQVVRSVSAAANHLDMPSLLALAAALDWTSGFRLYAVVLIVGAAGWVGWTPLPEGLQVLQNPALLGGSLAATAQAAKTTTRAAINTSSEPFSTVAMSLVEDGLVIGIVWLATNEPLIFAGVAAVAVLVMWVITWLLFKFLRAALGRLRGFFAGTVRAAG